MDETFIRRNFRLVTDPDDVFKRSNVFCVDEWGAITGVNASECRLEDLEGLSALHQLRYVDLSLNEIEDAEPLAALTSLIAIDLAFNRIHDIGFALDLPQLSFLDARNNRIRRLPSAFAAHRLPLLVEYEFQRYGIFLDGNPLEASLVAELHRGDAAVTAYLESLPEDSDNTPKGARQGSAAFVAPLAETAADTVPEPGFGRIHVADRLGTAVDADMLVSVLMARDTSPPLAVGLFGEWGSGKSFFMGLMQERVDELAALSRSGRPDAEPFCGEVRQVRFNAWHFVDTNLWASLAAALFDGLASSGRPDDAAVLLGDLDRARETAAKAREERESLERDVSTLESKVESPESAARSTVASALHTVRDDSDLRRKLREAASLDAATSDQTEEIVVALGNLHGFAETSTTLLQLFKDEILHRRRWLSLVATAALIGIGLLGILTGGWSVAAKAAAALSAVLAAIAPAAAGAVWVLLLARQAREARERPLRERRRKLRAAQAAEEKTNHAVLQHERELEELRDKGVRLRQFVRERALSSDYTQELGVISKMRRDLEELVSLLPSPEAVDPLAVAASVADRVPEVERIVLYIDDLDRCPEDKVVEVLQAVHLLLAFKLFVVVVGVDNRWLRSSLRSRYGGLLDEPDDYLEKIFQIPFTVRPMMPTAYRELIAELTASQALRKASQDPGGSPSEGDRPAPEALPEPAVDGSAHDHVAEDGSAPTPDVELAEIPPRPEGLVITDAETLLLGQLGALVPTPRSAKRLVNIYRMLRVSVTTDEAAAFGPNGAREYQAVIVLLAILIGLPRKADEIFREIQTAPKSDEIWSVMARVPGADQALEHLRPHVTVTGVAPYRRWAPRVARFSFRTAGPATT